MELRVVFALPSGIPSSQCCLVWELWWNSVSLSSHPSAPNINLSLRWIGSGSSLGEGEMLLWKREGGGKPRNGGLVAKTQLWGGGWSTVILIYWVLLSQPSGGSRVSVLINQFCWIFGTPGIPWLRCLKWYNFYESLHVPCCTVQPAVRAYGWMTLEEKNQKSYLLGPAVLWEALLEGNTSWEVKFGKIPVQHSLLRDFSLDFFHGDPECVRKIHKYWRFISKKETEES